MVTVEVIPYSNFKEKIRLTKELTRVLKPKVIEVFNSYIYVIIKGDTEDGKRTN